MVKYDNLSLPFSGDTDTGLYLGGTSGLGFVTNGTVTLELQGTQLEILGVTYTYLNILNIVVIQIQV